MFYTFFGIKSLVQKNLFFLCSFLCHCYCYNFDSLDLDAYTTNLFVIWNLV